MWSWRFRQIRLKKLKRWLDQPIRLSWPTEVFRSGRFRRLMLYSGSLLTGLALVGGLTVWSMSAPADFKAGKLVEVPSGSTLDEIANKLERHEVVRTSFWLRAFVILSDSEQSVVAGDYYFNEPLPVWAVADRLSRGRFGQDPIRVTLLEGWDIFRIGELLDERFERIKAEEVIELGREGYLFPDTYFFRPNITAQEVVSRMEENFHSQTADLKAMAENREIKFDEAVIMASILETEANTEQSKRKIADILWRRLEIEMPLQVDAAFNYVNGKNSYQLTLEDLRTDHPYNTYTRTGLPPTPIANPGLRALEAALDPIENDYWYFLSDLSSRMYYARDFEEHQYNRANFLRSY